MNILWETMVTEMRAERVEADARRHFTPEKKPIELVRATLTQWTAIQEPESPELVVAKSATGLRLAAGNDLFEMG